MARKLTTLALLALLPLLPKPANGAVVLEAQSIAIMRIEAAAPGAWTGDGPNQRRRVVKLDLVVERVFHGTLHAQEKLTIDAAQTEETGRVSAPVGPWSDKTLAKGERYLVFAESPSHVVRVTGVDESESVEFALGFEEHHWPLGELAARAGQRRGQLGPIFAEYLAAKLPSAVPQGLAQWNSIAGFIEDPGLTPVFRRMAATAAMDAVLAQSPAPEPVVQRTVVMAFRLMGLPDEGSFRERLAQTYLPNLLGFEGTELRRSARQIFDAYPTEQQRAAIALSTLAQSSARARLEAWIAGKQ